MQPACYNLPSNGLALAKKSDVRGLHYGVYLLLRFWWWLFLRLTSRVGCACARICCDRSALAASMADCVCELVQVPMQHMNAPCVRVLCLCVHMAFSFYCFVLVYVIDASVVHACACGKIWSPLVVGLPLRNVPARTSVADIVRLWLWAYMPWVLHMHCACAAMWSELRMCILIVKNVYVNCARVLWLLLDSQSVPCKVSWLLGNIGGFSLSYGVGWQKFSSIWLAARVCTQLLCTVFCFCQECIDGVWTCHMSVVCAALL